MSLPRRVYRGEAAVPTGKALGIERSGARQEAVAGADPRRVEHAQRVPRAPNATLPDQSLGLADASSLLRRGMLGRVVFRAPPLRLRGCVPEAKFVCPWEDGRTLFSSWPFWTRLLVKTYCHPQNQCVQRFLGLLADMRREWKFWVNHWWVVEIGGTWSPGITSALEV